ncbi:MAG: glycoside hydrolase family 3 N-terminal domain-containing protein [Bacteroidia bacterium]
MKRLANILGIVLGILLALVLAAALAVYVQRARQSAANMRLLGDTAPRLTVAGISFRDLNKNGRPDPYEDPRTPLDARVDDLLGQMTLEEKAGLLFVPMIAMQPDGGLLETPVLGGGMMPLGLSLLLPSNSHLVARQHINSFNILDNYPADVLATWNNNIQQLAERTRLGIPATIASDPRHVSGNNLAASIATPAFSAWPTTLGLAATRDTALVRAFGDIARQEYLAVGIRLALHPMADLATEPRWGRINGTFGEDAALAAALTRAYVLGFQGDTLGPASVACMSKHFSGGGPQADGEDPHFPYGQEQAYPGQNFAYHLIPFVQGVLAARTAQIMPYYGIPVGQTSEDVGFAFNKDIITTLLRDSLGFDGVVCTDWNIITDNPLGEARAWGVSHLSPIERVQKVLEAGCDQFGGENVPELIVELVRTGRVPEARIDVSARRVLRDKFRLGLFDDPYLDVAQATRIAGRADFREAGRAAQRRSTVLLKNEGLLPLRPGGKIYAEGWTRPEVLAGYGTVVDRPEDADVILLRLQTPYDPRDQYFIEQFFRQGRLYYDEAEQARVLGHIANKPTVVCVTLDRPAILTEIAAEAPALMADFGIDDDILAELIFGKALPAGKLPFELPSSWEAVQAQAEDLPYDSRDPLYPFGFGLSY